MKHILLNFRSIFITLRMEKNKGPELLRARALSLLVVLSGSRRLAAMAAKALAFGLHKGFELVALRCG